MLVGYVEKTVKTYGAGRCRFERNEPPANVHGTADNLAQVMAHEAYREILRHPDRKFELHYRRAAHPERNYPVRNYIGDLPTKRGYINTYLVEYEFIEVF